jgi:ABC-type sugar transport system ATPase subunit
MVYVTHDQVEAMTLADRIVVLHEGEIVQVGSHQRLISERTGGYWKFFEQQKLKEELESYQNDFSRRC